METLQWNIRGLQANREELNILLSDFIPTTACLQETFLNAYSFIFLNHFFITFLYFFVLTVFFLLFYGGQFNGLCGLSDNLK